MDVYPVHGAHRFTAAFGVVAGLCADRADRFHGDGISTGRADPGARGGTGRINVTRTIIAHKLVIRSAILPFAIGALIGSAIGGKIVISIPVSLLQAILGVFMLYVCFAPKITAGVPTGRRFFVLGTLGAFISMFIGATGTILAPGARRQR